LTNEAEVLHNIIARESGFKKQGKKLLQSGVGANGEK
jgi:hypothetical protein